MMPHIKKENPIGFGEVQRSSEAIRDQTLKTLSTKYLKSSNIFSIGEEDAHDLLEEDLWEDFNKDDVTLFTSKDDRTENEENVPQNVNKSHQVSGPNNSSGFIKASLSAASNGDTDDSVKRQESNCHGLRPSALNPKQFQPSGGFASSFQSNAKDLPSPVPGSCSDGKRKCLTNLANRNNNHFVSIATQNGSKVPQKHTFNFKATAQRLSNNVSSSLRTPESSDVDERTRPIRNNGGSKIESEVDVHPGQALQHGETATRGFQKFLASAKTVKEKMLDMDRQISNSPTVDGKNTMNTDGHREHSFYNDGGDSVSSHRTVTSAPNVLSKTIKETKQEVSLNSSGTALAKEKQSPSQFIPESSKSGLNSRRQLLPNRESHDEDSGKAVSANMSPPVSQFQKKNSIGHTPVNSWIASNCLRPTSHPGLNQSSTFQTYGNKGALTPHNAGRDSWRSPRPGTSNTPVNSSVRHKPADKSSMQQFPSPQLPVFTPRVAQLCKTPTGPGMGGQTRSSSRKFPGPAGILPKLSPGQDLSNMKMSPPSEEEREEKEKEIVQTSQACGFDDFSQGAWKTMKAELGLDEKDPKSLLSQHNIASVLRKASMKQLQRNKVPHICVLIKLITFHVSDAVVTFRDPTGEMQGTLHRSLIEEYQSDLKPGCVLLLKQVGVLSPSLRNHYLNVTRKNVVQIFPPHQISSQASPSSSQLKQRISPKSIKVNNCDTTPQKIEESEQFPKRFESPLRYSIGKDVEKHASGLYRDENRSRGEGGELKGSERKRLSDEGRQDGTKRICLELSCKESQGKESKNMQPGNTKQSEETIADLIEGFEDELFEDF